MTFAEAGEQFEYIPIHIYIYRLFSFLTFSYISAVKFCSHIVRYWDVIKLPLCESCNRK